MPMSYKPLAFILLIVLLVGALLCLNAALVLAAPPLPGTESPAAPAAPPAPPASAVYHVVCWGENLSRIARMYGTSVWAIANANGISNINRIYVGQVLLIPGVGPVPVPVPVPGTYVVRSGDTLTGIALRFGVSVWAIVQANGLWDPNRIYIGQTLVIP